MTFFDLPKGLNESSSQLFYRGYRIHWSGWIEDWAGQGKTLVKRSNRLVGHWKAWPTRSGEAMVPADRFFYAAVEGGQGEYHRGDKFNIEAEAPITVQTSEKEKFVACWGGFVRLLRVLDEAEA